MRILKNFYQFMLYTILAIFAFKAFQIIYPELELILEVHDFKFGTIFKLSNIIIAILFTGASTIAFALKALVSLISMFYYGLFYEDRCTRMQIKIDENNRIRESYMELKNGDIIPVIISKIITDKHIEFEENNNE